MKWVCSCNFINVTPICPNCGSDAPETESKITRKQLEEDIKLALDHSSCNCKKCLSLIDKYFKLF